MGVPDHCVHPGDCRCASCVEFRTEEAKLVRQSKEMEQLRADVARLTARLAEIDDVLALESGLDVTDRECAGRIGAILYMARERDRLKAEAECDNIAWDEMQAALGGGTDCIHEAGKLRAALAAVTRERDEARAAQVQVEWSGGTNQAHEYALVHVQAWCFAADVVVARQCQRWLCDMTDGLRAVSGGKT